MPKAIHPSILSIPASNHPAFEPDGLVLEAGVPLPVTDDQARVLVHYEGVSILPDEGMEQPFNGSEVPAADPSASVPPAPPSRDRKAARDAATEPTRPETPAAAGSDAKE